MTSSCKKGGKRGKKGGNGAASNMLKVVGNLNEQLKNTLGVQNTSQSNALVSMNGQRAGKRGKKMSMTKRRKNGGFWGQIINQAAVPAALLGMQQTYRRRRSVGGRKSRKGGRKY